MKLLALLLAALLLGPTAPAGAAPTHRHAPHCKVLERTSVVQTRDVRGVIMGVTWKDGRPVYTYGTGIQHRTVTTVTERCRGKVSTSTTATAWSY